MRTRCVLLASAAVTLASPAAAWTLSDSLKDFAPKGTPVGGSFDATGWTVTQKDDRIYYSLPRLVQGSIEFTVSGITEANLVLADHEIFALYEGGYGISEPINYNPQFRNNHYKQLLRIYGKMVLERLGEQKFIMLMCPSGAPGYTEDGPCPCPQSFYDGDGWWGGNKNWDGSPSKIKVRWGNGSATYSRDGVDVWTNDYSQTGLVFGPSELHFTIGCPRNSAADEAGMPIGATFSDVYVEGVEGPLATCGSGGAGGTAGASGAGGAGGGGPGCVKSGSIEAVSLSPQSSSGASATLVARYAHSGGATSLRIVQLLVGDPLAGAPYVAPALEAGKLHLGGATCAPGESKVLTDTHGSLDCSASSIAFSGNEVTVSWSLAFAQTLAGTQGVWFDAKGYPDDERLCWTKMGELTVEAGSGWAGGGGMPGTSGAAGRGETSDDDGGCGCRTRGRGDGGWLVLALMTAAVARRRLAKLDPRVGWHTHVVQSLGPWWMFRRSGTTTKSWTTGPERWRSSRSS
jgi:hypothetical protein